jgi:hypothetical protein
MAAELDPFGLKECASLREQLKESEAKCRALETENSGFAKQLAEVKAVIDDIPETVFVSAEQGYLDETDAIEAVGDLRIIQTLLGPPLHEMHDVGCARLERRGPCDCTRPKDGK